MQLEDNKCITEKVIKSLEADGWTISKLATAGVSQLAKYDGIGKITAQRIINESRKLMNEATIVETEEMIRTARQRRTPLEVIGMLEANNWTLEEIATTDPDKLLDYCYKNTAKDTIQLARQLVNEVQYSRSDLATIATLTGSLRVDGHRADLVILKAARAHAAFEGRTCIEDLDILLAADCAPFAYADFHREFLKDHALLVACPKLDDFGAHLSKLIAILKEAEPSSITVVHMEVPCCSGLVHMAHKAIEASGLNVPMHEVTISTIGDILSRRESVTSAST